MEVHFTLLNFRKKFISNISKKDNKKLLNMTLFEILETETIYSNDELLYFIQ